MTDFIDTNDIVPVDWIPENSIIKVIGVGGGGCNAVNYMYHERIQGCTFIVCNTDAQALNACDVPIKIQLGEGLGAGCNPTEGRNAALNSQEEIAEKVIDSKTEMLFITAGMGGGTGTGAAPVIAAMAKKKGILTVGVVTIPFKSEGNESMSKAIDGINELEKNVDSLIIINNEKIYKEYAGLLIQDAFPKADEVLATAVKGITEIIKKSGFINVDFKDVKAMMTGSGMALMGCGTGSGNNRIRDAVKTAMDSPLLNDFDIKTAKNVLINVTVGNNSEGLQMSQLEEIDKLIKEYTGNANNFKRGIVLDPDPSFGDKVSITVIATGFKMARIIEITEGNAGNIITIDSNFTYRKNEGVSEEGIELPEVRSQKIGYNNTAIRKRIAFEEGKKPALLISEGESKSELENTPAIKRVAGRNKE
jgi:cell division protein FtsZ